MRKANLIVATIVAAALTVVGVAPAHAATTPTATAEVENIHCAVEVAGIFDQDEGPAAPVCFATQDEVAAYLAETVGINETAAGARGEAANTVVGTVYQDANRGGASLTFWGSSGCAGATFGFPTLASGWDTTVSSAEGSNGCWLTLYTATSYGGARLNCTPYCASVGSWNDNVKALVFRPTGTFG